MNLLFRIKHAIGIFVHYYVKPNPAKLGYLGKGAQLGIPADLKKPENIYLHDYARIGRRSTIMTMGDSKFVMGTHSGSAEGLVVITSNHRQEIGTYRNGSNDDNEYHDVIVEEDVWIGANVTILSGSHIGRGCILGASCVLRGQSIPPYAMVIGNPAKVIGFRYTPDEVIEHEKLLYPEKDRLPLEKLRINYDKYYLKKIKEIAKYVKL